MLRCSSALSAKKKLERLAPPASGLGPPGGRKRAAVHGALGGERAAWCCPAAAGMRCPGALLA